MPKTIYQAGPLFSEAERRWHADLTKILEAGGYRAIWPGSLLTVRQIEAAGKDAPELIFSTCREALEASSLVVALLDGAQVDDGTAWEIGYAYARGLPVFGIRTDSRQSGDTPFNRMNSMVEKSLSGLAASKEELLSMLDGKG